MSELTIDETIKWIIGALVIVVVVLGLYFLFKNRIIDFFSGMPVGNESLNFWRIFLK